MTRIAELATHFLRIPLVRPWAEDVRDLSVVAVDVTDTDGAVGHGFSWTPTIGGRALQALLDHEIRDWAIGRPASLAAWRQRNRGGWDTLWRHLHEAGGGGITTIAMAGLDLALWDLAGRREERSVVDILGRRHDSAPAYGSGVNLHYPLADLVAQAERWVDAGFDTVKIKVGRPHLRDDVERVRAVREVLGPDRTLLIDANQRWTLDQAERAVEALADTGIGWIEEPLRADDLDGYVRLRERLAHGSAVPVACGENLHTLYRFREFAQAAAADVLQPNIVRVGGITPFLRIAGLISDAGLRLAPHLLPELSGQIALTMPHEAAVEAVEDAEFAWLGALTTVPPIAIEHGRVRFTAAPGTGITFRTPTPTQPAVLP